MPAVSDSVWSARDTSPGAVESAMRDLLVERHAENPSFAPARVLNLVTVVDREWSGEIANRLRAVGRSHASRTVVCAVEPRRRTIDAVATVASDVHPRPGEFALTRETIVLTLGPRHLEHLDTIVDPLVVTDLPTMVWSPHGHPEAVDSVASLCQVVLLDSIDEPEISDALTRARALGQRLHVVDLAWLRTTPWRERIAATFDPPPRRGQLRQISAVTVRHEPDSQVAGLLLLGWLAARLRWRPAPLIAGPAGTQGKASSRSGAVSLTLTAVPQAVRGLAGLTIETADGLSISLDRAPGGLAAVRRTPRGGEERWTILGASRGEGGILGGGIRAALARDAIYAPALQAASALVR